MSQKLVREGSIVKDEIPMTRVCCVCVLCVYPTPKWCLVIPAQGACRVNYANKAEHLFFLCIMYVAHDEPEKVLYS